MRYNVVGSSGLRVSAVGLGCSVFGASLDREGSQAVIHKAIDLGITLFDTADQYGNFDDRHGASETVLGETLGARRKDIVLGTKFGMPMDHAGKLAGASRTYVIAALDASLRRLKTDWIDLYYLHRPDPLTPIEETLRALDDLVRAGKVRYIGCSNMAAWQIVEAQWTAKHHNLHAFISSQEEYSLLVRNVEREILPVLDSYRLGLMPFFPLASGLLTGKYRREAPLPAESRLARIKRYADRNLSDRNWKIVEELDAFCRARDHSLLELAFSWLLSHKAVPSVIAGATRPDQLDQNVQASEWILTPDELAKIDAIAGQT